MRALLVLLLGLAGCSPAGMGGAVTVITLRTMVATGGVEMHPAQACVWLMGPGNAGAQMVVGHGIDVEECLVLGPP